MSILQSAELLSVGTELLLGEIVDTNSAYLAADLSQRGVDVYWSQRVGDNMSRITHAIRQGLERSDMVVMCGGLGPTDDDMSREAIAEVLGETPAVDAGLERDLRERFAKFSRHMPERNLKQAWLIPSAAALANPRGTAPGWLVRTQVEGKEKIIIALPGPPRELTRMWGKEAVPQLSLPTSALYTRMFKTLGLGESALAEQLGELTLQSNPSVATYAKRDGVHVRVAAKADTLVEAETIARPVVSQIETMLGEAVWGIDNEELVEKIHARLRERGLTLGTVETFTGGLLGQELSSVANSDTVYKGGVLAWSVQALADFGLDGGSNTMNSEQTALALAKSAAKQLKTDIGLATAHAAGNDQEGSFERFVAIYSAGGQQVQNIRLPKLEQSWLRERGSYAALFLLWSFLT